MRTTLNTIYSRIQTNLGKITTDMGRINDQISSGQQMSKISDEPVNLVSALRFRSTIVELGQYNENIQNGTTLINAAESALTQMKDLALRAKTLAIQATDPGYGATNLEAIAEEVKNMFEQAVSLANTQINGRYIFGGFRTTGYTEIEPAPFMIDKGDGYWVNGMPLASLPAALTGGVVKSAATATDLVANDLLINGVDVGAVDLTPALGNVNGINMRAADTLNTAINAAATSPAVTSTLTTQIYGAASLGAAGGEAIAFTINGAQVAYTATLGAAAVAAQEAVDAINAVAAESGVTAVRGDASNGGPANSVILKNTIAGDNSAINLVGLTAAMTNVTGLADGLSQGADATHNTGQVSLSSSAAISITTSEATGDPLTATDDILEQIGLGGGDTGNYDAAADGQLVYGYPLSAGDLKINGLEVPAPISDGVSDLYADASAGAKAEAINSITDDTGVTAVIIPATATATGAVSGGTETERLTGTVTNNTILANNLAINGTVVTNDINTGATNFGLNTEKAFNAQTEINAIASTTGVSARLTTLYDGGVAVAGVAQTVSFDLNNISISLLTGGVSNNDTAAAVVAAINGVSDQTGVQAVVGTGANGGDVDAIVLSNVIAGNENDITLANFDAGALALTGLAAGTHSVDLNNNTGQLSLESDGPFTITSPAAAPPSDIYLTELGLSSTENNGQINYGSTPTYLEDGDLTINGINIISITTAIVGRDFNNILIDAINAKTSQTKVLATHGQDGSLQLTAIDGDGRNLHIETSANGEAITHLTQGLRDLVTFGALQLRSDRKFILETIDPTLNANEPGLATLGLAGGESISGEPDDVAADGKINVFGIHNRIGSVRYTGDRVNDMEIKIGKTSTMTVGENGKTGVMDTTIFTTLKAMEDYLRGNNYTTVTGVHTATDTTVALNSRDTGLEPDSLLPDEDLFAAGSFKVSVTDHDTYPAQTTFMIIAVDPDYDTLGSVTARIDGIPNIRASWTDDGQLQIESSNPSRYTIALTEDNSNFLKATGVSPEFIQSQGIGQSIGDLDTLMENLTRQVSDFGSRANRIDIQSQIYSSMTITTKENLSEAQETDMIKAVMELRAKETAYQAALSAAAKTMQLSLVDYL